MSLHAGRGMKCGEQRLKGEAQPRRLMGQAVSFRCQTSTLIGAMK